MLGNMRFIGELFKVDLLNVRIPTTLQNLLKALSD
jgi:hypothetical protein